jgi:hypothetical protein
MPTLLMQCHAVVARDAPHEYCRSNQKRRPGVT